MDRMRTALLVAYLMFAANLTSASAENAPEGMTSTKNRSAPCWCNIAWNPHAFSVWMAGGGIRGGTTYGATDEFGYYVARTR